MRERRLDKSKRRLDVDQPHLIEACLAQLVERGRVDDAFTEGLSPIESMCECDKRGSRACGCLVISTGSGSCEYKVACPTFGKAFCSALNVELCIAGTVTDVFF